MTQRFRRGWLLGLTLAIAMVAAACGGDDNAGGGGTGEGTNLSGSIVIDGSSTVAPISEAITEEFRKEQSGVQVTVGTSGTGGGFTKFCAGETDIQDASRPITDEEKAACETKGIKYQEFRIGLDGLAVVSSAQNQFVTQLNFDQLAEIWKEGGAKTWNQVDSKFPNEKLAIFAPDTESGTYDFFTEQVLGNPDEGAPKPRSDYTASSDDNTLVQGIEGEANSWGYFGFAYYQNNKEGLKDIAISKEAGGPFITPSAETIESGEYPLSRPLFIYVKEDSLKKPEVGQYVKFYLEQTPQIIADVGYVPAPSEDYTQGLAKLQPFLTS
ncbi:MAG TPA: PstS family phosphate ABC transporter substrate-binding protein [Actinomycetota bacterium]|jgi:phosphate transport system substrate-binding protein|nr:PstS family phosphate ABC transporter substrate-binding protein [Actinomycetota bacterium]